MHTRSCKTVSKKLVRNEKILEMHLRSRTSVFKKLVRNEKILELKIVSKKLVRNEKILDMHRRRVPEKLSAKDLILQKIRDTLIDLPHRYRNKRFTAP